MWLLCDRLATRGHTEMDQDLMDQLQTVTPAVNDNPRVLHVFVCTVQILITMPGARGRFVHWSRQDGGGEQLDLGATETLEAAL